MLVSQILDSKSTRQVFSIGSSTTIAEAATELDRLGVGALVVSDDGIGSDGIVSERDIVRAIGKQGKGCLDQEVRSIMSQDVICCKLDDTADEVLATMTERRFRHMPVMKQDSMVGVISIGDVVKAKVDELNMERDALTGMISGNF